MAKKYRSETKQLGTRIDADLYEWLREQGDRLPPARGQGKRPDDRRADYVRKVLEDHRKGGGYVGEIMDAAEVAGLQTYRNLMQTDPNALRAMFRLTGLAQKFSPDVGYLVEILADLVEAAYGERAPLVPGSVERPSSTTRQGQ